MDDRFGLPMTTNSTVAGQLCMDGLDLLLENNYGPDLLFQEAIEADEGFAWAYGLLAFTHMQQARPQEARSNSAKARELSAEISSGVSNRERQQIEAIARWCTGEGPQAMPIIHQHLTEFPRDMVALRLAQRLYILGCNGAAVPDYPDHLFKLTKSIEKENDGEWSFLSTYAFAHHEVGLLHEALNLAERSLKIRPGNAVAAHSGAHSYFEMGDHEAGTAFLGGWLPGFDKRAQYYVHLSWHLALFELATGHYQRAFDLYEANIRPSVVAGKATSLNDSASLMWRWQIYAGQAPPFSWDEVREIAAPAAQTPGPAFRDAHAALALAASGDDAIMDQMLDRLDAAAKAGNPLISEMTLPLAKGIRAFAQGDYAQAVAQLEPVFPQLARMGGSHAQREVFEDTLLEAYLRAEQFDKAEDMLRIRLQRRETTRDTFWMARMQAATGKAEEARANIETVAQGWQESESASEEARAVVSLSQSLE